MNVKIVNSGKFYAVARGRKPGIYFSWPECQKQTQGFSNPVFKSFHSKNDAINYLEKFADVYDIDIDAICNNHDLSIDTKKRKRGEGEEGEEEEPISKKRRRHDEIVIDQVIYTDGSCTGNGSKDATGGYGIFFGDGDPRNFSGRMEGPRVTNNRAELKAVIEALRMMDKSNAIEIKTDNVYVINSTVNWEMNSGDANLVNRDLIEELVTLKKQFRHVRFTYTKAHCGIHGNEMADRLAKMCGRVTGNKL